MGNQELINQELFSANKQQRSDSGPRPDKCEHDRRMLALWIRLTEGWGHKFTSSAGEEPNGTWVDSLSNLTHEQFLRGANTLMASTDSWPPSVGEFRQWCIGGITQKEARHAAIEEWERGGRGVDKYNPFNAGRTYDQIERDRRNFIDDRVAEVTMQEVNQRRRLNHQEEITDPLRICRDDQYN